jgi:hypothetical protein
MGSLQTTLLLALAFPTCGYLLSFVPDEYFRQNRLYGNSVRCTKAVIRSVFLAVGVILGVVAMVLAIVQVGHWGE